jgi:hypothetical protein
MGLLKAKLSVAGMWHTLAGKRFWLPSIILFVSRDLFCLSMVMFSLLYRFSFPFKPSNWLLGIESVYHIAWYIIVSSSFVIPSAAVYVDRIYRIVIFPYMKFLCFLIRDRALISKWSYLNLDVSGRLIHFVFNYGTFHRGVSNEKCWRSLILYRCDLLWFVICCNSKCHVALVYERQIVGHYLHLSWF